MYFESTQIPMFQRSYFCSSSGTLSLMSTQFLSIQNLTTYPTALRTQLKSTCEVSHISGQTFKTTSVCARNVQGSQLNYGRREALRELLIENLRHLFVETAYIKYCTQLAAILYQCRNMRHSSSYDLNSSARIFRTT